MDYGIALSTLKQADPKLARVIQQVGDCRLIDVQQTGDVFFSLSKSILYQQLSTQSATAIYKRFAQLYPESPSAEAILSTPDETLRGVGISRQKIVYLKDLAQKTVEGLPAIADLESLDDETIIQSLTQVKGIGRWTVQMLLIFRLHRWDVLPTDDLGVRSSIRHLYGLDELPTKKQVEQIGERWKPYRTIASWYLWRCLE